MSNNLKKVAVFSEADCQRVPKELRVFSTEQLKLILERTPKHHVKKRKGRGGQVWSYVNGAYCVKMLNVVFGFNWDFQIIEKQYDLDIGQCFVQGRLTVRIGDKIITKEQFGRSDIKFRKIKEDNSEVWVSKPLDVGNDLKAASTDAMKKCATQLGFFSDVYYADDFIDLEIVEEDKKEQKAIYKRVKTLDFHLSKCKDLESIEKIETQYISSYNGDLYDEEIALFEDYKKRLK